MKLHINKKESSEGLPFLKKKIYEMFVKLEMTPEEREGYERVKEEIGSMIIVEYSYKGTEIDFKIKDAVYTNDKGGEGSRFVFANKHEISSMEEAINEGVKRFSSYMKKELAGGDLGQKTTDF